ncbi:lytic murein transglycosylase [Candidatus Nomurabacteria bacterium]|nr:lytic murein transglycosylase [Candidatus Nomurabacteria bacterium]
MHRQLSWKKIFISTLLMVGLFLSFTPTYAITVEERRSILEDELKQLEKEIAQQEAQLADQKKQTGSIKRDLDIIRTEIKQKRLEIEKKEKLISDLSYTIRQKNSTINELTSELDREKQSLAQILRNMHTLSSYTFVEFLWGDESLSNMFLDIDQYENIQGSLQDSFLSIEDLKEKTRAEREELKAKQDAESNVKYALEIDKAQVEEKESEKNTLHQISVSQEKTYEQVIAEKKERYDQVTTALFNLRGVSGGALQFGTAYELAKQAGRTTGIDPAFILAILKQETNFGANTGTCNRTGDTRTWQQIMPGPNDNSWRDDQTIYLGLTKTLGLSAVGQPLSCPLASGGWGGAMGISQFIPATWASYGGFSKAGVYSASADRIRQTLGSGVISNPWNNLHGITATALYMKDLGAGAKTYTAEREAACKYYSGRGCSAPGVSNAFYGNAVMSHKIEIQQNIDILEAGY